MKEGNPGFEPYEGEKPYIFVSYSHKDKEVIDDLEKLSKLGFRIWYDAGILTGAEWGQSIDIHLKACSVFMIFISDNAVQSDYVLEEVGTAKEKDLPIVPIFLNKNADPGIEYRTMLRRQGIERWNKSLDDYYFNLYKKLHKVASHTREDPIDRDSMILGISYLPVMKDVICDKKTSLTPEEQEERRIRIVNSIRDTDPPISSYHIGNIFQITSEVTQALHNLGELEMDQFEFNSERPTNMLTLPLNLDKVYVAPLRLVTGLITRLDQNWPPLVASYKVLVKAQRDKLDDLHYYIEFCWLAWGPSILTTSLLNQSNKFMVVQAAFGDEANSLPLIMKKTTWKFFEDKFKKRDYGWSVSIKNVVVVRPGTDCFFDEFQNDEHLFKDIFFDANLTDTKQVALYLPHDDDVYPNGEINKVTDVQDACYSTAYVWLMLEQIMPNEIDNEDIRPNPLEPGKVIPFFEHANLGTTKGLMFLQHCLARKAIYHVLECEIDPEYRDKGYYRFATALFPDDMVEIIKMEISRLKKKDKEILKKRFKIPEEKFWRSPLDVVKFADDVEKAIEVCCKESIEISVCELCDKRLNCKQYIVKLDKAEAVIGD